MACTSTDMDPNEKSSVKIGDVSDGIHDSTIVGRDVVVQIVQRAGGQAPPIRNLPAQILALQQALPHLTHSAEKAAAQATIDSLEQAIAALSEHEKVYRERIRTRYAEDAPYYVPLAGVTTETASPQIATEASRSARRRKQRAEAEYHEWIQSGQERRRVKLKNLREGVDKYECIILLGDPGSGKTTALESLAYQFAGEEGKLPVPLRLSEFLPALSLEDFIVQGWAGSLNSNHWGAAELADNLDGYLEEGRLFFLLDALNEMPREGFKERAMALRQFIDTWAKKGNRFLVTCRVLDYCKELSGLQRVEVQPLNDEQIRTFLRKEIPDRWQSLWRTLTEGEPADNTDRKLLKMARNPYILTMMIDVFSEDGELGRNRAELMTRFAQILMGWAKEKIPPGEWLSAKAQQECLSVLAFEMQERDPSGTMVQSELVKIVMPQGVTIEPDWPLVPTPPAQVLSLAAAAKIIEMPMDRSSVRFYHQLLQEYFSAFQMLKREPRDLTEKWRWPWWLERDMPAVGERGYLDPLPPPPQTGWEETTILAAGLSSKNVVRLMRALIEINPVLAGRCLNEGQAKVSEVDRQIVIDALLATIGQPEVALRVRIAAGETLGCLGDPRLGEMVTIPHGEFLMGIEKSGKARHQQVLYLPEYRIGRYPVTNAEYGQFIEAGGYKDKQWWTEHGWVEKRSNGWTQPENWQDNRFNKPNQPVVSVSWYECLAYCQWLSAEKGRVYRLPTDAEWEKAARGDDGRSYPWGNKFDTSRLNAREGKQPVGLTTPVGIYPTGASPYGVFDSAGNVWEWCSTMSISDSTLVESYSYDVGKNEWSPSYLQGVDRRVLRGGAFCINVLKCRSTCSNSDNPARRSSLNGFRVVSA